MMNDSKDNIKFNYLYRDAANYKVWGYEIFSNPKSLSLSEIEDRLRSELIDGEFFDPRDWKLKRLKHEDWIPELDHLLNEYHSLEFTDGTPTTCSISEFLIAITKIHKY